MPIISIGKNKYIILPKWSKRDDHVFHLFVIRTKYREKLIEKLSAAGVETMIQ